jgi:hypothetical protein
MSPSAARRLNGIRSHFTKGWPPLDWSKVKLGDIEYEVHQSSTPNRLPLLRTALNIDAYTADNLHFLLQKYILGAFEDMAPITKLSSSQDKTYSWFLNQDHTLGV